MTFVIFTAKWHIALCSAFVVSFRDYLMTPCLHKWLIIVGLYMRLIMHYQKELSMRQEGLDTYLKAVSQHSP